MDNAKYTICPLASDMSALFKPRYRLLVGASVLLVINRIAFLVLPVSTKVVVDEIIGKHRRQLLAPLIIVVIITTIIQAITSFGITHLLSKSAQKLVAELRLKVYAHVSCLPISFFDANKTGNLASRIMMDVEGVRNVMGTNMVELLGGGILAIFTLPMLIWISPLLTGLTIATIAGFSFFLKKAFGRIHPLLKKHAELVAEVTGRVTESLAGIRVVKGYYAEAREQKVFAAGVDRILETDLQSLTTISIMGFVATVLIGGLGATVALLGAQLILRGSVTLGGFATFTVLLGFLTFPIFQAVNSASKIAEAMAGLQRSQELLRERRGGEDDRRKNNLEDIYGRIIFDKVGFEYQKNRPVLLEVSFVAEPGTVTAFIGSSGAGKSTIIGLISAFYSATSGGILVNGVDLCTVRLEWYRTQIGVVLQETFLFDGSIRENVMFSRPQASEDEFLCACRIAAVSEFAEHFQEGYETIVGERGVKLSGGQRQRISIA